MGEGLHFYKIRGKYYIISAMPGAHTDMVVARSDSLDGPWQIEPMIRGESLGVPTQSSLNVTGEGAAATFQINGHNPNEGGGLTLHQGGMVDTPSGQWWAILMQDHGSIGRLSGLVPITWKDDFPVVGLPGNLRKAPNTWLKPDTGNPPDRAAAPKPLFVRNDNFDSEKLNPLWQWNHFPDDSKWSLAEKPGVLRLHSLRAPDFWMARNTLTQRAVGPESSVTVEVDAAGMKPGDTAGLALLNRPYAWIGLAKNTDGLRLTVYDQTTGETIVEPVAPNIFGCGRRVSLIANERSSVGVPMAVSSTTAACLRWCFNSRRFRAFATVFLITRRPAPRADLRTSTIFAWWSRGRPASSVRFPSGKQSC